MGRGMRFGADTSVSHLLFLVGISGKAIKFSRILMTMKQDHACKTPPNPGTWPESINTFPGLSPFPLWFRGSSEEPEPGNDDAWEMGGGRGRAGDPGRETGVGDRNKKQRHQGWSSKRLRVRSHENHVKVRPLNPGGYDRQVCLRPKHF